MNAPTGEAPPTFKLYDKWSVAIATFLGSPLAGGVLLWRNYGNVGRKQGGRRVLWMCGAATLALFILGLLLPDSFARIGRPMFLWGPACALYAIADGGDPRSFVEMHTARGGQMASRWLAAGIGLGVLAALVVVILGGVLLLSVMGYDFE